MAPVRQLAVAACVVFTVLLVACGGREDAVSDSPEPGGEPQAASVPELPSVAAESAPERPSGEPLVLSVSARPACTGPGGQAAGCGARNVGGYGLFSTAPDGSAAYIEPGAPTVEEVLESGLKLAKASPTQLAFRGTAAADSVRCSWRGIARTNTQREQAIRFWLGLDTDDTLPSAAFLETLFRVTLDTLDPEFRATAKSNFLAIARGGLTTEYLFLTCYAEYTVHEYLLGAGPTKLVVAYEDRGETRSYELYRREHENGSFGEEALLSEAEFEERMDRVVWEGEEELSAIIAGHESVVFVAPLGAHNAIAVEAWLAVDQWDLQEDDDDTVHAVRYGTSTGDPEHTQTLAALKTRITTAAAADAHATTRIANASGLRGYYRTMGAYGDITPGDGETTTFTPAQPPAALTCAGGTAVTAPDTNRALVHDCEILLDHKAALAGTATLNWSATTAIASWDGVTTGGTPLRVTGLALSSKSLSGTIPAALGDLSELTTLNLSSNSLTGAIPPELGMLYQLTTLRLSGNSFTGCIPVALEDVATNDLSSLSLLYCSPPAPAKPVAATTAEGSIGLSWGAVSNTSKYRVEYRRDRDEGWTEDSAAVTGTTHTVDGLLCEGMYVFRVSAYGGGTTYAAGWSAPSAALRTTTSDCTHPEFGSASYSFTVAENSATGTAVGTVAATDAGGDTVTYAISEGNEGGAFAIDASTGAITVAGALDYESTPVHALTVSAGDAAGGSATATVAVTVTDANDPPVGEDDSATAVGVALLTISVLANDHDEDAGATLTVTAVTQPANGAAAVTSDSTGVTYTANAGFKGDDTFTYTVSDGTESASATVTVTVTSYCSNGTVVPNPASNPGLVSDCEALLAIRDVLAGDMDTTDWHPMGNWNTSTAIKSWRGVRVSGTPRRVTRLDFGADGLEGTLPAQLGALTKLERLSLGWNQLTGPIPAELGNLSSLTRLVLRDNRLTGSIPTELGNLTELEHLQLQVNRLTGPIPPELGSLADLIFLELDSNNLTGSIPPELGDLSELLVLSLSGNSLTGCVPLPLKDVPIQDLSRLGLPDCPPRSSLTVTVTGEGGSVSPAGRTWHTTGSSVTLTASWNDATHSFGGWGDDCRGATSTCVLTMDAARTVTASFAALAADRCATSSEASCIRVVYRGAPGDYAQASDVPASAILTPNSDGRYEVRRGQQITVITAAPLPDGYTRFYLQRQSQPGSRPTTAERLIQPLGTSYTFTVAADTADGTRITYDLTAARPRPLPRPGQKPELGDVVVTITFQVVVDSNP